MKKICISLVFMCTMLQLSASQDNSVISTIAFTASIACIAWMQQPVWVKQLGIKIKEMCEITDITTDTEQGDVVNKSQVSFVDSAEKIEKVSDAYLDDKQNSFGVHGDEGHYNSSLEFQGYDRLNHPDYDHEVDSLLSSTVYVIPADYCQSACS